MAGNIEIDDHVFYDEVSTITETRTAIIDVRNNMSTLMIEFDCDGTFTANILGAIFSKAFKEIPVIKLQNDAVSLISSSDISDDTYFYQIDVTSLDYVKVILTALTGTITVNGKAVG